jgi:hypothetical protein
MCVSDEHPYVQQQVQIGELDRVDAKQKLVDGQLRVSLGVHPMFNLETLGIKEDSLRKCVCRWLTNAVVCCWQLLACLHAGLGSGLHG